MTGLFGAQVLNFGLRCSVRGPGAQFRPSCSVQGPGARFRAQVLSSEPRCSVQGSGAQFGAQVLGLGPICPDWAPGLNPGPAKNYLMTFLKIILLIHSTGITWSVELKLSTLKNSNSNWPIRVKI